MKIQVLENNMINKIAAGEVVERPVSVVKELAENSIDAGASSVTVEIKDGGISYIRVSDNGQGIPKEELKSAFLRHATSKIRNFDDLAGVLTLGFRGEALSSISSVSQVEMVTKTAGSVSGAKIEIHGGQIISFSDAGASGGTTVIMRNLFYNTPARRKFLKKASTEAGYIHELMQRLSLAHPEVSFKYINNNQNMISTNGNGDLKTAVFYVYGKEISSKLIPVLAESGKIRISGFICAPETARGNRSFGNFFINGRYIKDKIVQSAIEDAFKNRIMTGKFPIYILNMNIEPNFVDVNVHPSKMEVRFENEEEIYSIVFNAVKKAFEGTNLISEVKWDQAQREKKTHLVEDSALAREEAANPKLRQVLNLTNIKLSDLVYGNGAPLFEGISKNTGVLEQNKIEKPVAQAGEEKISAGGTEQFGTEGSVPSSAIKGGAKKQNSGIIAQGAAEKPYSGAADGKTNGNSKDEIFSGYKIVGQIFDTYWIIEQKDKMYLIDQHAAHERVLFEEYLEKFSSGSITSQLLLEPVSVRLAPVESETVRENRELFAAFGFELEEFGQDIFIIRALPYIFAEPCRAEFFIEIVDTLAGFKGNATNLYEFKRDAIASLSCKAAVKANRILSESECAGLIKRLLELDNPYACPHGRPTIITMSRYEVEKKFKRH